MVEKNTEHPDWLTRGTDNIVRGPFTKRQILQLIKAGELKGKAEIAPANSFWFYIDEKPLLEQYFPELAPGTATNLKVVTEKTKTLTKTLGLSNAMESESLEMDGDTTAPPLDGESTKTSIASDEDLDLIKKLQNAKVLPQLKKPEDMQRSTRPMAAAIDPTSAKLLKPQEPAAKSWKQSPILYALVGIAVAALIGVLVWTSQNGINSLPVSNNEPPVEQSPFDSVQGGAKLPPLRAATLNDAFLLAEYPLVQNFIRDLEQKVKADPQLAISQAMMKSRFLMDNDGAVSQLEYAKGLVKQKNLQMAEIENLLGIYSIGTDPNYAFERLKGALMISPKEKIFRFNLAVALFNTRKFPQAEQVFNELMGTLTIDDPLALDCLMGLGMALEQTRGINDAQAEHYYKKALELDPQSAEARILLAQRLFRRGEVKEAEAHMKIFIDSMPELDGKMNVESYRKMPWSGFYEMIRSSLRDAQSVIKNSNAQTSVTAVAADAMITAILGQNVEAEQLATQALTTAVGNTEAIKALLFLRYREGKDSDVMDLASEKAKDPKESFGLSIVIGKAYYRLGKYAQAAKIFSDAVGKSPDRSDAWALLGEAQLAQGNEKEALAAFSTGLQKNQFNQRAIRGLSRLKKNEHLANPLYKGLLPI